jgi:hypothetical protein
MSRPRKKARVYHVPQDETISVTSVSSSSSHQVVTQSVLPLPLQDNDAKTPMIPPATINEVGSASKMADSQAKQRYTSSVSPLWFGALRVLPLFLFLFCFVFCF